MNNIQALVIKATDANATLPEKHDAFNSIVLSFQDMAYGVAYALLGDFQLAEDAAQEAFIGAWQKLYQLHQPAAFPGWFRKILHTECNRIRRRKSHQTISLDDGTSVPSITDDPQKAIEHIELRTEVFSAIEKLSINERVVVTLFYLREWTHEDIGVFLEVPTTTVAKRLYSARERLRGPMMSKFKKTLSTRRPSRNASFAEKVRAGLYDEYLGRYRFELRPELVVTVVKEGDRLISESAGQRNILFADDGQENELKASEFDGRGTFIRNRRGRISHLIYYEFGCEMGIAKKIAPNAANRQRKSI